MNKNSCIIESAASGHLTFSTCRTRRKYGDNIGLGWRPAEASVSHSTKSIYKICKF